MERINELFPRYDDNGKRLIKAAFDIASDALKNHTRSNGGSAGHIIGRSHLLR